MKNLSKHTINGQTEGLPCNKDALYWWVIDENTSKQAIYGRGMEKCFKKPTMCVQ